MERAGDLGGGGGEGEEGLEEERVAVLAVSGGRRGAVLTECRLLQVPVMVEMKVEMGEEVASVDVGLEEDSVSPSLL